MAGRQFLKLVFVVRFHASQPGFFASEAHKDEHPAFNRRAVGSIPTGRTRSLP